MQNIRNILQYKKMLGISLCLLAVSIIYGFVFVRAQSNTSTFKINIGFPDKERPYIYGNPGVSLLMGCTPQSVSGMDASKVEELTHGFGKIILEHPDGTEAIGGPGDYKYFVKIQFGWERMAEIHASACDDNNPFFTVITNPFDPGFFIPVSESVPWNKNGVTELTSTVRVPIIVDAVDQDGKTFRLRPRVARVDGKPASMTLWTGREENDRLGLKVRRKGKHIIELYVSGYEPYTATIEFDPAVNKEPIIHKAQFNRIGAYPKSYFKYYDTPKANPVHRAIKKSVIPHVYQDFGPNYFGGCVYSNPQITSSCNDTDKTNTCPDGHLMIYQTADCYGPPGAIEFYPEECGRIFVGADPNTNAPIYKTECHIPFKGWKPGEPLPGKKIKIDCIPWGKNFTDDELMEFGPDVLAYEQISRRIANNAFNLSFGPVRESDVERIESNKPLGQFDPLPFGGNIQRETYSTSYPSCPILCGNNALNQGEECDPPGSKSKDDKKICNNQCKWDEKQIIVSQGKVTSQSSDTTFSSSKTTHLTVVGIKKEAAIQPQDPEYSTYCRHTAPSKDATPSELEQYPSCLAASFISDEGVDVTDTTPIIPLYLEKEGEDIYWQNILPISKTSKTKIYIYGEALKPIANSEFEFTPAPQFDQCVNVSSTRANTVANVRSGVFQAIGGIFNRLRNLLLTTPLVASVHAQEVTSAGQCQVLHAFKAKKPLRVMMMAPTSGSALRVDAMSSALLTVEPLNTVNDRVSIKLLTQQLPTSCGSSSVSSHITCQQDLQRALEESACQEVPNIIVGIGSSQTSWSVTGAPTIVMLGSDDALDPARAAVIVANAIGSAFGLADEFEYEQSDALSGGINCRLTAPSQLPKVWTEKIGSGGEGLLKVGTFSGCAGLGKIAIKPTQESLMSNPFLFVENIKNAFGLFNEAYVMDVFDALFR